MGWENVYDLLCCRHLKLSNDPVKNKFIILV